MNRNQIDKLTAAIKTLEETLAAKTHATELYTELDERHKVDDKRNERVYIDVQLVLLKLIELDTFKENFTASVFFALKWREPLLDTAEDPLTFDDFWNPKILIDNNALNYSKEIIWYEVKREDGKAFIVENHRVEGTFLGKVNLTAFPFDTQKLGISLISERSENEVFFVEDCRNISITYEKCVAEWYLHDRIDFETITSSEEFKQTKNKRPGIKVSCRVTRKPWSFLCNVILIMALIVALSLITFAVQPHQLHGRLQLTMILMLMLVALKFTVRNRLPRISYITYLDVYFMISFIYMAFVCVWHAIVENLNDYKADQALVTVFACIFIVYHVIFGVIIIQSQGKNMSCFVMKNTSRAGYRIV